MGYSKANDLVGARLSCFIFTSYAVTVYNQLVKNHYNTDNLTNKEETEAFFKCLAELGVNVIVSGKYFASSVLRLLITAYRLMAIEIILESEMNHFCMMAEPVPIVTIARKEGHNSIFTLILHGSTNMILDKLVAIAGHAVQTYTICLLMCLSLAS
ncbi:hypothetical protein Bca4012_091244 [Brassica carinata]